MHILGTLGALALGSLSLVLLAPDDAVSPAAAPTGQQCVQPSGEPIPANAAPGSTWLSTDAPPVRFQGDAQTQIEFVSKEEANRICAGGTPVCGRVFYACRRGDKLTMPNPCQYPMTDPYAKLLCHEIAHVNQWPATHGD